MKGTCNLVPENDLYAVLAWSMTSQLPEALMRAIDLNYPSNRWAVGGSLGALVLGRLAGKSWPEAGRLGLLAFAAWATARELDPDHAETANAALPLAVVLAWTDGERTFLAAGADLAASGATLLSLRYLTGSVGATPGPADQFVLAGLAGATALAGQRYASLLPALSQGMLELLVQGQTSLSRKSALPGGLGLLPGVLPSSKAGNPTRLVTFLSLLLGTITTRQEHISSETDTGQGKISDQRVQLARIAAQASSALALLQGQGTVLGAVNLALGVRRLGNH